MCKLRYLVAYTQKRAVVKRLARLTKDQVIHGSNLVRDKTRVSETAL